MNMLKDDEIDPIFTGILCQCKVITQRGGDGEEKISKSDQHDCLENEVVTSTCPGSIHDETCGERKERIR